MKKGDLIWIIAIIAVVAIVKVIAAGDIAQTQQGLSRDEAIQMVLDVLEESVILTNTIYANSCIDTCNNQNKTCVAAHKRIYNSTATDTWYEPIECREEQSIGQKLCTCAQP